MFQIVAHGANSGQSGFFLRRFVMVLARPFHVAFLMVAGELPGDREVIRELHKMLGKDPFFKKMKPISLKLNLDWLNHFLQKIANLFHYPLLIILGIAVLVGLYFLIRSLIPYVQGNSSQNRPVSQTTEPEKDLPPNHFLVFYRRALEQSQVGEYRQALISLHKATVEYLLAKVVITSPHKKFTNNDLKRKLYDNHLLYQPFCIITGYAEIAGFSTIEVGPGDFSHALEAFESSFLRERL
jgi:hypothetical protein